MKQHADGYTRSLQENIRAIRGWIAFKTLLVAALPLILAVVFGLTWLTEEAPEEWHTETVRYARIARIVTGRGGTDYRFETEDGRRFRTTYQRATAVEEKLNSGAICEITYRRRLGVASICGLISGGDVIIDGHELALDWPAEHAKLLKATAALMGAAILVAGLCYGLLCRRDRLHIAQLQAKIARREAKNQARAAKKAARQVS